MAYQATSEEKIVIKSLIEKWRLCKNSAAAISSTDEFLNDDFLVMEEYYAEHETAKKHAKNLLMFMLNTENASKLDWQSVDSIISSSHMTNVYMEAIEEKYSK